MPATETANDLRPICFMVMPFKRKSVSRAAPGAPAEVDFDRLWEEAFRPAIEQLGYLPVRADADPGSLIVKDMFERLALADLVLADVSLPNGNVYYEIGMRHVARQTGCVLLAADWSRQLFDIDQFRSLRYALTRSEVSATEAEAIRSVIETHVPALAESPTPYHELIKNTDADDARKRSVFRDFMQRLSEFQGSARGIRLLPADKKLARIVELAGQFAPSMDVPEVSLELLRLYRDEMGWEESLAFVERLPEKIRQLPYVREQHALILSESGEPERAIAALEQLIDESGASPERHGLIGGRYKRLWREARDARIAEGKERPGAAERRLLSNAIDQYSHGMQCDLNDYYCSSNLPALLRARGQEGDDGQAVAIEHLVVAACERADALDSGDEWLWPTMLGAAFRSGDTRKAHELANRVEMAGAPRWNLESVLRDLKDVISSTPSETTRGHLQEIYEQLSEMLAA